VLISFKKSGIKRGKVYRRMDIEAKSKFLKVISRSLAGIFKRQFS
jgi:hypothetical protein